MQSSAAGSAWLDRAVKEPAAIRMARIGNHCIVRFGIVPPRRVPRSAVRRTSLYCWCSGPTVKRVRRRLPGPLWHSYLNLHEQLTDVFRTTSDAPRPTAARPRRFRGFARIVQVVAAGWRAPLVPAMVALLRKRAFRRSTNIARGWAHTSISAKPLASASALPRLRPGRWLLRLSTRDRTVATNAGMMVFAPTTAKAQPKMAAALRSRSYASRTRLPGQQGRYAHSAVYLYLLRQNNDSGAERLLMRIALRARNDMSVAQECRMSRLML